MTTHGLYVKQSFFKLALITATFLFGAFSYATPTPTQTSATSAQAISASAGFFTCTLTTADGVKCWGNDTTLNGDYLGVEGTIMTNSLTPVDVVGLTSGVAAISTGNQHACALTTVGGVKCWGINPDGRIGDGTTANFKPTPVDVVGLTSGVAAVSVGNSHTCALTTVSGVKCWGRNVESQLGDGTFVTERLTPVDVVGLTSGVVAISAHNNHTCALTTTDGIKCWGQNSQGQLGDGTTVDRQMPVNVIGLTSGVKAISDGMSDHTCALTTTSGVKCWGFNSNGQLGDGSVMSVSGAPPYGKLTPVDVVGLTSGVAAISTGMQNTCALTTVGGVKCWGANYIGQLGDGTAVQKLTPVDVVGLTSGVAEVSVGSAHNCVLTTVGGLKCWGFNRYGQLGDGTIVNKLTPVDVIGFGGVTSTPTPTATITTKPTTTMTPTPIVTVYISARAGTGGTINPSGKVSVLKGVDQTFEITPMLPAKYEINDVKVDGVSQGAIASYTFSDVEAKHKILASFKIRSYNITVTNEQPDLGKLNFTGVKILKYGKSLSIKAKPINATTTAEISVDGNVVTSSLLGKAATYKLLVDGEHTISVRFF